MSNDSLTLGMIRETARRLEAMMNPFDKFNAIRLAGFNIVEAPVKIEPKLKVSDDVIVSDEFRVRMNKELLEMFGTREVCAVEKGMAYIFDGRVIMRSDNISMLTNIGV